MKSKKIIRISVIAVVVLSLIIGAIYFYTHYAIIDRKIYKTDIKRLDVLLDTYEINEINKCTEIEEMFLSEANDDLVSRFKKFNNLNKLFITISDISSSGSEKISTFDNLKEFCTYYTNIDFKGFSNDSVSYISLGCGKVANLESLSECNSLKNLEIYELTVSNNCIVVEDNKYVMKDSSIFSDFDYVEKLMILVDEIEDISGILEMDSLKTFEVDKGTLSEDDKKLLEDKGISVIYYDKMNHSFY